MLFFIIFLSVYGLANAYVLRRFLQNAVFMPDKLRIAFIALFVIGAISYIVAKIVSGKLNNFIYDYLLWFGSMWFAFLLYSFLFWITVDLVRLLGYIVKAMSHGQYYLPPFNPTILFATALVFVGIILAYGYHNAKKITIRELSVNLRENKAPQNKQIKALFFSDVHLTPINNGCVMDQILAVQNEYQPDVILMGGDIIDDKPQQLIRHGIDARLRQLKAPMGVFAIPGNHEYISGSEEAFQFMRQAGIRLLLDEVVQTDRGIQIAGRNDYSARNSAQGRKSALEIRAMANPSLPLLVMDHQPFHLDESEKAGFDILLCGHTHNGQLAPFNYITKRIYEISWGYLKKGAMNVYVSCGAGTWGPQFRTGSKSEVIILTINY